MKCNKNFEKMGKYKSKVTNILHSYILYLGYHKANMLQPIWSVVGTQHLGRGWGGVAAKHSRVWDV